MNKIPYFVCCRSSSPVFCGTREEKRPTLFPLASMRTSRQVTQTLSNPPLAEFCVPCVPSGTGRTTHSQPPHKTTQGPRFAPRKPRVAEQAMACSGRNPRVRSTRLFLSEKHRVSPPREGLCGEFTPQVGKRSVLTRSGAGLGHTGASLVEVTGEAGKQENHFHFSASLRLETKHTVVSNPHTPPF